MLGFGIIVVGDVGTVRILDQESFLLGEGEGLLSCGIIHGVVDDLFMSFLHELLQSRHITLIIKLNKKIREIAIEMFH